MFIHVSRDYAVALEEPQEFKRFNLAVDAPQSDRAQLVEALTGVASLSEDGHAWVSEAWLRARDPAPQWQEGLTAMIVVAKKYGWVDEAAKAIRAHIEWRGDKAS